MSCAWETEYDTTGRSSPRLPHELYFEIGGPKPVGTAAQTASQTGKLFWVSRIKMAALMWTVVDTRTIARRSNKVRCFSVNSFLDAYRGVRHTLKYSLSGAQPRFLLGQIWDKHFGRLETLL